MRSDQGLQFVDCIKELETAINQWDFKEVKSEVVKRGITWKFNTPLAPHQGGLWEAAVKSMKYHLRRVVGDHLLTGEEFNTLLVRIEGILNSRPLTRHSDDPADLTALTPAHFVLGGPIVRPLGACVMETPDNRLDNWQLLHKMEQQFADRWQTEYLATKMARNKWRTPAKQLKVGDLIFLKEDNLPPGQWLIGRITSVMPGSDGVVRNVKLRTPYGEYVRSVTKCCYLPAEPNEGKTMK